MSSSPLYKQIAKKLKNEIQDGTLLPGDAIPSEHKLAEKYEVSRVTIRQAIDLLVSQQLLHRIQGSGTYVSEQKIEHDIYRLQGFTEEMASLNKEATNEVLQFELREPSEKIKDILRLAGEERTFYVKRLRSIEGVPVVLEKTYLPVGLFPDLSYEVMTGSKYEFIEKHKKMKIKQSFQQVIPVLPDAEVQKLLQIPETAPILKVLLWSTLQDDIVFEYTELYFKSEEYKFTIVANR